MKGATYFITLEVRTPNTLGVTQRGKLLDDVVAALDNAELPYCADVVTSAIGRSPEDTPS